jgi:Mrp family chromosome partitioning ATPase
MSKRFGIEAHKNIVSDPTLSPQVQLLRAHVEAEIGKPAIVMVTSAQAGDGKSLTAYSLAASFADCDHRVALVSREESNRISRDELAIFVEEMRSDYDFTVIDAETFVNSSTVMALTRLVDGILLTVRIGRAPTADDEAMIRMIEHFGGRVLGVVATEVDAIPRSRPRRKAEQNPARALLAAAADLLLG